MAQLIKYTPELGRIINGARQLVDSINNVPREDAKTTRTTYAIDDGNYITKTQLDDALKYDGFFTLRLDIDDQEEDTGEDTEENTDTQQEEEPTQYILNVLNGKDATYNPDKTAGVAKVNTGFFSANQNRIYLNTAYTSSTKEGILCTAWLKFTKPHDDIKDNDGTIIEPAQNTYTLTVDFIESEPTNEGISSSILFPDDAWYTTRHLIGYVEKTGDDMNVVQTSRYLPNITVYAFLTYDDTQIKYN